MKILYTQTGLPVGSLEESAAGDEGKKKQGGKQTSCVSGSLGQRVPVVLLS